VDGRPGSHPEQEAQLQRIREALAQGSQKIDQLLGFLEKMEKMHAETSEGFSETLVKAYGRVLEDENSNGPAVS